MRRYLSGIFCLLLSASFLSTAAQDSTTSVDPALLALQNARAPKEYTINRIRITGLTSLDTAVVASLSGLQRGDKVLVPGGDAFSKAIANLWRQRFFSNVQIFITAVKDDNIDIEIALQERPKLGNFKFVGIKKGEAEELEGKAGLVRQTIITENTRRNAVEVIRNYFADKGYNNVEVRITENPDPQYPNSNELVFYINKNNKVKVDEISFYGNEAVTDAQLTKRFDGVKERSKFTLNPAENKSVFGTNEKLTFSQYMKDFGFLSISRTKELIEPYFRFKLFSSAKFDRNKFEEDLQSVISYYNSLGYRDAQIADTAITTNENGNLHVQVKVNEGSRYYFGNIAWRGNSKYPDSLLAQVLGIRKGDIYNIELLNTRLGKQLSQEGGDISGLYMDDGYLFFRVDPVETAVYNDTIDFEIRIVEGQQARYRNITISGNEKTKDYVIRRELRTRPGELFSRADIIRTTRELANLQFFNPEKINPNVVPDPSDGTVDIEWQLEERSSDQLESTLR